MFKLSKVVDALTAEYVDEVPKAFTWTTPIRHDPFLIGQLQRANLELRTLFAIAAQASDDALFDAAADALLNCMTKLREVQRLEALRLYPVLGHQASGNANANATVAYLRLRTHTLARRFLRLSEGLTSACRARQRVEASAFAEARVALGGYIEAKELQLYEAYTATSVASVAASAG
jgi:hypothetical protein